ncbi:tyrosine-type recombinase/integrase [Flavobacterium sp.]|jgi:integrase/recombinase XerC|uniref:tyrosine-type recombinase/integrase n=1 Tax=Flavobacterium sp. TaxID=239 RepID=UPI0022CCD8CD|nr:tyrosine-type recombinase/integrase [Flavobacterium sp.]MCZ8144308.1 tyrosine-type recombinase/integrase [Flavobacterium sp.]MCZ8367676.1 tyrosine-type recombinase/integrase [Flavobacterium sp.]
MTYLQAFQEYLALEKKYSPHTVLAYHNDLLFFQQFLKSVYELEAMEAAHYPMIRSWIVSMVDDGMSTTSVNRKVSSLKAFYKFLLKLGVLQSSPLAQHKALKTPKKVQVPFSEVELDNVLNTLEFPKGFEGVRDKLIIDLFYTTGIRRAELIGLRMHQVDLEGGMLKVLGKRNKERMVPLLPVVVQQMEVYLKERAGIENLIDTDYFFLMLKGVKLSESFVYRLINSYFSNVSEKVKKSPHVLRHTFATHLLNQGADINSVKELLGHSSLASTQVYTHSSLAELQHVHRAAHPRNRK